MIKDTRKHAIGEFPIGIGYWDDRMDNICEAYGNFYESVENGRDMTDWVNWPAEYFGSEEYERLKSTANEIRLRNSSVIVVGIGGSYLTPRAVISSIYGEDYNSIAGIPRMYFAGCDLSPDKLERIMTLVAVGDWSIIYISKSGGTAEPAITFRILWKELVAKYGEVKANERVYAVTDAKKGVLKALADKHGWQTFVIPDGIGGRYSAFTPCGLLPIAVAGIDTDRLLKGAIDAMDACDYGYDSEEDKDKSWLAMQYLEWKYSIFCHDIYAVELFCTNTPDLSFLAEWLKQLFGESEGKNGEGMFPASACFPTDLHSLGQFLQEGTKNLIFETFLVREFNEDIVIPDVDLDDNLQNRVGKKYSQAAAAAMDGAFKAHAEGGNPCGFITLGSSLEDLGYFMQSMFIACAVYCDLIGVNPFDQPGVEAHKKNMVNSPEWDK